MNQKERQSRDRGQGAGDTQQKRPFRYYLSVDASYDRNSNLVGIGMVVQGTDKPKQRGPVIHEYSEAYANIPSKSMEEFAVLRALEIASEFGYQHVRVRSDFNQMRKELKEDQKKTDCLESNDLHGAILRLSKQFQEAKFGYVPRRKNQTAHKLARKATQEAIPRMGHSVFAEGRNDNEARLS